MYIWILLATIMMMFSFYNLAPRVDKENAIVEVKAATVVNRFRAESSAFMKAFECQAILGVDPNGTEWKNGEYVFSSGEHADFGYTTYDANLPVGYELKEGFETMNTVMCLNMPIHQVKDDEETDLATKLCGGPSISEPIYMISYAQIPEQWISKTNEKQPVPELIHYVSDANNGGITYGWVTCSSDDEGAFGCQLSGFHSRFADVEDTGERDENDMIIQKRMYKNIPQNSPLWNLIPGFKNEINGCLEKPCLFAFHRVPGADRKSACRRMMCEHSEDINLPIGMCDDL